MQAEPAPAPEHQPHRPTSPTSPPPGSGDSGVDAATITARFATALRDRRRTRAWSQAHLAAAMRGLGFSWAQTTVAKTEAATRPVTIAEAVALAALLGDTVDAMLGQEKHLGLIADLVWARHRLTRARYDAAVAAGAVTAATASYTAAQTAYTAAHIPAPGGMQPTAGQVSSAGVSS